MDKSSAQNMKKYTQMLSETIGVRLAGSPQERAAAEYIGSTFAEFGGNVVIEEFPVVQRCVESETLEIFYEGHWQAFPCSLFGSSPSTKGQTIEAELVYFDTATGYQHSDLSFLTGKAVVHLGCHIESAENYHRLMAARPAFILFVDTRYPGTIQLADGLFPAYVKTYGAVPSLNVAYMDAWNWKTGKSRYARINVAGQLLESLSTNVVYEWKGMDPDAEIIYAGGHHDTQAGTVGADDNAIGSAAVLELARLLSTKQHKRTFRLISFGTEEQLSVGSASYVRKHRAEIEKRGVFMCNFDSFGSVLGWGEFTINAKEPLCELIRKSYHDEGVSFVEKHNIDPYTDQFPFAACGVPGIWIFRRNCDSGLFYHHRIDNTVDKLDFEVTASYVDGAARVLDYLANVDDLSVYRGIPETMTSEIATMFESVYGGWNS